MSTNDQLAGLSNDTLLAEVKRAAANERQATVQLIALLGEVETRRLYLREGCASLFTYCTQVLHLSEDAAFFRIEAARAARDYPIILQMLQEGAVTPTVVRLLRPHLTAANHCEVLETARHKSKREIESLIATLRPEPAVPASVRKLPAPKRAPTPPLVEESAPGARATVAVPPGHVPERATVVPSKPPAIRPLAPERYKIQFTMSAETHAKLQRVQNLMRHKVPNGDPAEIFDRALTVLLEHLQRTKLADVPRPRRRAPSTTARTRHIPASVRREVWKRDGGRCAFVGTEGRCTETGFLEFHHIEPYAAGGATTIQNLQLRCRAHNAYEAELFFGSGAGVLRERPADYVTRKVVPERVRAAISTGRVCRINRERLGRGVFRKPAETSKAPLRHSRRKP